jgi:hypothetical protein
MVGHCLPKFLRAAESFQIDSVVYRRLATNNEKHHDATQVTAGCDAARMALPVSRLCLHDPNYYGLATTTTASTSTNITSKINTSNNDVTAYINRERVLQYPRALDSAVHFRRNGAVGAAATARGGAFEGGCGRWVHF